ncbi:MAG TPA: protease complex subunit PrcB family protein [Candidatus Merdisoma merdipullorum]|nr:protease complex subunit PrcB family protein [Candidatus Merdisoma merdipullorum]
MWKRVVLIGSILIFLSGCSVQKNETEKLKDLDYTIVEEKEVPEELQGILEEKKTESFKLTYEAEGSLYLCIGYGEQATGGYSISVAELYLSENAIYFDTNLIGPDPSETVSETVSYPYLVIRTEYLDKPVVFQ